MLDFLPADLVSLLSRESEFNVDPDLLESGRLTFHSPADLRISTLYVAPRGMKDPNRRRRGIYRIPAVSLVKECERYDPRHLLTYLPFERSYAAWDGDHALLTCFGAATWAQIAADPEPYVNALWERKPRVPVVRNIEPWLRYQFLRNEFC